MHVPETESQDFSTLKVDGKKITAPRASLSFNPNGELKLVNMTQAKIEGETVEFNGFFEIKNGVATQLPKDSPILKGYSWNYVSPTFRKWLSEN